MTRSRSESRPPSTSPVHREDDECVSMRRVSLKSAKKGRISDFAYDRIQEESIQISCEREERSVTYALECPPDEYSDDGEAVIREALDDQELDLDAWDELDISLVWIDEAS